MATSDDGPLEALGQVAIRVHHLARAVESYRDDALRLRHLFRAPGMALLECGGVRLMLTLPESDEFDHPSSLLYFEVEGIDGTHRELRARGAEFERDPHKVADLGASELWLAFFRDPDRNLMALMAERPRED